MTILVGTAGWTIPRQNAAAFPDAGSSLERYAACLPVTEINSSFHREHRVSTWQRWHDSVPPAFRFSAKLPKAITHVAKLRDCSELLDAFLEQARPLGKKLDVLLVQLPPKLEFERKLVTTFFESLRARSQAKIACEPRNRTWFTGEADSLLRNLKVARVAADPAIDDAASSPGGWNGFAYWRLHGSPVIYRSSYADEIPHLADRLKSADSGKRDVWCIFDNTASSAAMTDALLLADTVA